MTTAPAPTARPWYVRFGWILVLVLGLVAYLLELVTMVSTQNLNFFPSMLLIGALTVPLSVLMLSTGGRETIVPPSIVALTAICGGVIGTLTAGILEYNVLKALSVGQMLAVGIIEEGVKMIGPIILLFASSRLRDVRAGTIIGVASGAGFAVLETMGYGFNALLQSRSIAGADSTLLLRALLAPAGHVAWTGLTCTALWHWRYGAHRGGRGLLGVAGAYVAAVILHALWDGTSILWIHIGVVVISVGMLLWLIHRSHRAPIGRAGGADPTRVQ